MGRRECNDVNECRRNPCGKYGKCRNTIGSYKCYCSRGFKWNGRTCIDINECRRGRVCGRYARCYNTPGSYYCKCYNSGYKKIGRKCVDINECKNNPCPSDAKCYNYPGSYRCACKRGYQFVNGKCVDYNECKYRGRCEHICLNTPGSFYCRCRKGFELYKKRYCVDINECRCNNGGCPFPYRCVNKPGHHYCDCPFGFGVRGKMCHLLIPQKQLNFTLPNNQKTLPRINLPEQNSTLAPSEG
ncbi:fibulin-1-like [Octopus sinensis]|uniref:Fibulin-1-like n=1 Tax=Octopus sinensis TaxID=2607531 RepID=A0A7E6FRP3_9MOLL|nr:fibulin-1-like [Octopus sinensis]